MINQRWLQTTKSLVKMRAKVLLGKEVRINSEERHILEETIFPHFVARDDIRRVLFVGSAPYTAHYYDLWPNKEFWTIDVDPRQRSFGSPNHIIDSVENLRNHFTSEYFDLVFLNGVIGFGVNTLDSCERTLEACYWCLRESGELIIGWNQAPPYNPVSLEEIEALALFQAKTFPPLEAWRYLCKTDPLLHTYDFYIKLYRDQPSEE